MATSRVQAPGARAERRHVEEAAGDRDVFEEVQRNSSAIVLARGHKEFLACNAVGRLPPRKSDRDKHSSRAGP